MAACYDTESTEDERAILKYRSMMENQITKSDDQSKLTDKEILSGTEIDHLTTTTSTKRKRSTRGHMSTVAMNESSDSSLCGDGGTETSNRLHESPSFTVPERRERKKGRPDTIQQSRTDVELIETIITKYGPIGKWDEKLFHKIETPRNTRLRQNSPYQYVRLQHIKRKTNPDMFLGGEVSTSNIIIHILRDELYDMFRNENNTNERFKEIMSSLSKKPLYLSYPHYIKHFRKCQTSNTSNNRQNFTYFVSKMENRQQIGYWVARLLEAHPRCSFQQWSDFMSVFKSEFDSDFPKAEPFMIPKRRPDQYQHAVMRDEPSLLVDDNTAGDKEMAHSDQNQVQEDEGLAQTKTLMVHSEPEVSCSVNVVEETFARSNVVHHASNENMELDTATVHTLPHTDPQYNELRIRLPVKIQGDGKVIYRRRHDYPISGLDHVNSPREPCMIPERQPDQDLRMSVEPCLHGNTAGEKDIARTDQNNQEQKEEGLAQKEAVTVHSEPQVICEVSVREATCVPGDMVHHASIENTEPGSSVERVLSSINSIHGDTECRVTPQPHFHQFESRDDAPSQIKSPLRREPVRCEHDRPDWENGTTGTPGKHPPGADHTNVADGQELAMAVDMTATLSVEPMEVEPPTDLLPPIKLGKISDEESDPDDADARSVRTDYTYADGQLVDLPKDTTEEFLQQLVEDSSTDEDEEEVRVSSKTPSLRYSASRIFAKVGLYQLTFEDIVDFSEYRMDSQHMNFLLERLLKKYDASRVDVFPMLHRRIGRTRDRMRNTIPGMDPYTAAPSYDFESNAPNRIIIRPYQHCPNDRFMTIVRDNNARRVILYDPYKGRFKNPQEIINSVRESVINSDPVRKTQEWSVSFAQDMHQEIPDGSRPNYDVLYVTAVVDTYLKHERHRKIHVKEPGQTLIKLVHKIGTISLIHTMPVFNGESLRDRVRESQALERSSFGQIIQTISSLGRVTDDELDEIIYHVKKRYSKAPVGIHPTSVFARSPEGTTWAYSDINEKGARLVLFPVSDQSNHLLIAHDKVQDRVYVYTTFPRSNYMTIYTESKINAAITRELCKGKKGHVHVIGPRHVEYTHSSLYVISLIQEILSEQKLPSSFTPNIPKVRHELIRSLLGVACGGKQIIADTFNAQITELRKLCNSHPKVSRLHDKKFDTKEGTRTPHAEIAKPPVFTDDEHYRMGDLNVTSLSSYRLSDIAIVKEILDPYKALSFESASRIWDIFKDAYPSTIYCVPRPRFIYSMNVGPPDAPLSEKIFEWRCNRSEREENGEKVVYDISDPLHPVRIDTTRPILQFFMHRQHCTVLYIKVSEDSEKERTENKRKGKCRIYDSHAQIGFAENGAQAFDRLVREEFIDLLKGTILPFYLPTGDDNKIAWDVNFAFTTQQPLDELSCAHRPLHTLRLFLAGNKKPKYVGPIDQMYIRFKLAVTVLNASKDGKYYITDYLAFHGAESIAAALTDFSPDKPDGNTNGPVSHEKACALLRAVLDQNEHPLTSILRDSVIRARIDPLVPLTHKHMLNQMDSMRNLCSEHMRQEREKFRKELDEKTKKVEEISEELATLRKKSNEEGQAKEPHPPAGGIKPQTTLEDSKVRNPAQYE